MMAKWYTPSPIKCLYTDLSAFKNIKQGTKIYLGVLAIGLCYFHIGDLRTSTSLSISGHSGGQDTLSNVVPVVAGALNGGFGGGSELLLKSVASAGWELPSPTSISQTLIWRYSSLCGFFCSLNIILLYSLSLFFLPPSLNFINIS